MGSVSLQVCVALKRDQSLNSLRCNETLELQNVTLEQHPQQMQKLANRKATPLKSVYGQCSSSICVALRRNESLNSLARRTKNSKNGIPGSKVCLWAVSLEPRCVALARNESLNSLSSADRLTRQSISADDSKNGKFGQSSLVMGSVPLQDV